MGIIRKNFIVEGNTAQANGQAVIDNGSDCTVLRKDVACAAGFNVQHAREGAVQDVGGSILVGHWMPVRIAVGSRRAIVDAFVPAMRETENGHVAYEPRENLIGADFLQGSGARLDYSRHHNQVFSGMPYSTLPDIGFGPVTYLQVTPEQSRALKRFSRCRPRRRRR